MGQTIQRTVMLRRVDSDPHISSQSSVKVCFVPAPNVIDVVEKEKMMVRKVYLHFQLILRV